MCLIQNGFAKQVVGGANTAMCILIGLQLCSSPIRWFHYLWFLLLINDWNFWLTFLIFCIHCNLLKVSLSWILWIHLWFLLNKLFISWIFWMDNSTNFMMLHFYYTLCHFYRKQKTNFKSQRTKFSSFFFSELKSFEF